MVEVQEAITRFRRIQVALKIASIICGVISLFLFILVLLVLFEIDIDYEAAETVPNIVPYLVIGGSLMLVGFAVNFVVLDYCLRARVREMAAIARLGDESTDLAFRFAVKTKTHSIVLIVFAWLGVAQAVYGLALYIALPAATSILGGPVEWDIIGILIGLTPSLIHFRLARMLSDQSKNIAAQLKSAAK